MTGTKLSYQDASTARGYLGRGRGGAMKARAAPTKRRTSKGPRPRGLTGRQHRPLVGPARGRRRRRLRQDTGPRSTVRTRYWMELGTGRKERGPSRPERAGTQLLHDVGGGTNYNHFWAFLKKCHETGPWIYRGLPTAMDLVPPGMRAWASSQWEVHGGIPHASAPPRGYLVPAPP